MADWSCPTDAAADISRGNTRLAAGRAVEFGPRWSAQRTGLPATGLPRRGADVMTAGNGATHQQGTYRQNPHPGPTDDEGIIVDGQHQSARSTRSPGQDIEDVPMLAWPAFDAQELAPVSQRPRTGSRRPPDRFGRHRKGRGCGPERSGRQETSIERRPTAMHRFVNVHPWPVDQPGIVDDRTDHRPLPPLGMVTHRSIGVMPATRNDSAATHASATTLEKGPGPRHIKPDHAEGRGSVCRDRRGWSVVTAAAQQKRGMPALGCKGRARSLRLGHRLTLLRGAPGTATSHGSPQRQPPGAITEDG